MQRFHHLAVQHDALDAALLAFAERAFRGNADLVHSGWRGVALMRATSSAICVSKSGSIIAGSIAMNRKP